jgi:hypothetical protein
VFVADTLHVQSTYESSSLVDEKEISNHGNDDGFES